MKILHTADWHIGNKPGPTIEGRNLRYEDTINAIDDMINQAKNLEPDLVVVTGDVTDKSKLWGDQTIKQTMQLYNKLEELSSICPTVLLFGTENHDSMKAFDLLMEMSADNTGLFIINKPIGFVLDVANEPCYISCIPGVSRSVFRQKEQFNGLDKEAENIAINNELANIVSGLGAKAPKGMKSILLGHYTVVGCEDKEDHIFNRSEIVLSHNSIEAGNFDLVCLGHIHRAQKVAGFNTPVYYSGNINALTFTDEGNQKGFYIHDLNDSLESTFYTVDHRKFITLHVDESYISNVLNDGCGFPENVDNKIVRAFYTCSSEFEQSFSKKQFEKSLMDHGAFWVQSIEPESITDQINKDGLKNSLDIRLNLSEYLKKPELGISSSQQADIIQKSDAIIQKIEASHENLIASGIFVPISISVTNYRKYKKEFFDFTDVKSAIIQGPNGIGKSSLFMDAPTDALFEETRSGDLTSWISNDPDVKSGSMTFVFKIGEIVYKVIRTRTKSGSTTLSLQQFIDNDWTDISGTNKTQTQDKINKTLGMTSQTFKVCMMIMQDQYDLVLKADKSQRMATLIDLLGLSIYEDLEKATHNTRLEIKRQLTAKSAEQDILSDSLGKVQELETMLKEFSDKKEAANQILKEAEEHKSLIDYKIKTITEQTSKRDELISKRTKSLNDIDTIEFKINSTERDLEEQRSFAASEKSNSEVIKKLEESKEQLMDMGNPNNQMERLERELRDIDKNIIEQTNIKHDMESQIKRIERDLSQYQNLSWSDEEEAKLKALGLEYQERFETTEKIHNLKDRLSKIYNTINYVQYEIDGRNKSLNQKLDGLKKRVSIMENANCIDITKAQCAFLADAKEAQAEIPEIEAELSKITPDHEELKKLQEERAIVESDIQDLLSIGIKPFDDKDQRLSMKADLDALIEQQQSYNVSKDIIKSYEERLEDSKQRYNTAQNALSNLYAKSSTVSDQIKDIESSVKEYQTIKSFIDLNKHAYDDQKRIQTAKSEVHVLTARLNTLKADLERIRVERMELLEEINGLGDFGNINEYKESLDLATKSINAKKYDLENILTEIGSIKSQLDTAKESVTKYKELDKEIKQLGSTVDDYQKLQKAFNQDGIPYQIIRLMSEKIQNNANKWLAKLTGGKMSINIILDKVQKSNSSKEVATMDVIINDYEGNALPYIDKSGGERVRVALAFSVALAEIKAEEVGIKSGFFMVDEPPFLDSEGINAYCDILDLLGKEYKDMKILAITHDPEMKSRFNQVIEVTESGIVSYL